MKVKKLQKVIVIVIVIICIMAGTMSYGANTTSTSGKKASNNTTSTQKKDEGLSKLEIGEAELSPKFETTTHEYTVKYIGEKDSLPIEIEATEAYYNVEILGNKNLKEGENLITILVTDEEEKNIATYQLIVNKSLVDKEAEAKKQEEAQKQEKIIKIAGGAIAGIFLLIIIESIVKKIKNRNENWDEFEEEEEELPKALKHKNRERGKRYK